LAIKYDERVNKALNLAKHVKYSVYQADLKMSVVEIDKHGLKVIFEAVDLLK
jgi:hypothetical protein